ncbi:MAG: N-acetylmuramoyl-L-alanine amidase [Lentisphaeraceae bacterium]|nr:N-acetylmuramoyl-L-alanine amidase [Lentisphaeraceae bacterium]
MQVQEKLITFCHSEKLPFFSTLISAFFALTLSIYFFSSCQTLRKPYIYKIQSGDTLTDIAKISGISISQIKKFNKLTTDKVKSADMLLLPGVTKLKRGGLLQELSFTTRSQWQAKKPRNMRQAPPYSRITLHHTSDSKDTFPSDNKAYLRSIQNHHQRANKWADIAYHFLIGENGEIFEGRLLCYQGAHVKRHNPGNIGIALLGNFDTQKLNLAQTKTLTKLLDALRERYDIDRSQLYAHKDLGHTLCPGKYGWEFLQNHKGN